MSLISLRIKKPHLPRPFRSPLNIRIKGYELPITALLGALATFSVWCLIIIDKVEGRYLGLGWMIVGITMYLLYRRKKKIIATGQLSIEKIKIEGLKKFKIKKIIVPIKNIEGSGILQMACELAKLHESKIVILHLIEVPYSVPLDSHMPFREAQGQAILQYMEAIAREYNVEVEMEMRYSRNLSESILEEAKDQKCDLIVIGAHTNKRLARGLGPVTEKVLKRSLCRVSVYSDKK